MLKKLLKKLSKPRVVAKKAKKPAKEGRAQKPIGKITHFYGGIKVAIIKFSRDVKSGTTIYVKGATTDFEQKIESMQFDHKPLRLAKKGKLIGIKVKKRVRQGDEVFVK